MQDWIIRLVDMGGYAGVALLMFIETIFPPIPSEVIMTVAGVAAARGTLSYAGVVAAGTAGAMVGNYLWFLLAIHLGRDRLRGFVERHSRWLTLDWSSVERGQKMFDRHGAAIIGVARMLPTFRSMISIPAGLFAMPHRRFLLFSALGTAGWNAALAGFGYALGASVQDVESYLGPISTAIIILIVLGYIWRLFRWRSGQPD